MIELNSDGVDALIQGEDGQVGLRFDRITFAMGTQIMEVQFWLEGKLLGWQHMPHLKVGTSMTLRDLMGILEMKGMERLTRTN